jgi:pyruvate formate lyase activating enzyme
MRHTDNLINNNTITGTVFEIERYALHEGPGIRTLVFLKGCCLRCLWCCNPESQAHPPQLVYWTNKCIGCGVCVENCPRQALTLADSGISIDRSRCRVCGKCADLCNAEALVLIGREMTPGQVLAEVLKDSLFYRKSGGGVTFSGGEPLIQHEFLKETAKICKENGVNTAIETSGCVRWEIIEEVLPYIDLFLYDLKEMDENRHKRFTGVGNDMILNNFKKLVKIGKELVVRIPIITAHNDRDENYRRIIEFLKPRAPGIRIDLLPYHRLGKAKYDRLDQNYELNAIDPPTQERMAEIQKLFVQNNFSVSIGG